MGFDVSKNDDNLIDCFSGNIERQATNGGGSDASPLAGKTFVLVGAGGAGRALAFGAKSRGAHVIVFNRNYGKLC